MLMVRVDSLLFQIVAMARLRPKAPKNKDKISVAESQSVQARATMPCRVPCEFAGSEALLLIAVWHKRATLGCCRYKCPGTRQYFKGVAKECREELCPNSSSAGAPGTPTEPEQPAPKRHKQNQGSADPDASAVSTPPMQPSEQPDQELWWQRGTPEELQQHAVYLEKQVIFLSKERVSAA